MRKSLTTAASFALVLAVTSSAATAAPALNRCWGEIRSQLNQLETPEGTNGGAGGQHSRSTTAANINGGFASDDNGFGITFNVKEDGGNAGRTGVGNVSVGAPHFGVHGNAANGQHAVNNSNDPDSGLGFANILDPVSGQFLAPGETNGNLQCSLTDETP
ncbi:MAG: hypothetical protein JNM89_13735 [Hyphomicrobiaceae bacterium]|nr:hypothetical protein [Hyphomicrobiaceae bacterium]